MKKTVVCLIMMLMMGGAYATCNLDGKRTQSVTLSFEGRKVDQWTIASSGIHSVRLPHGFNLGLQIEPATPEKYRELLARTKWPSVDELVKITLLDMSTAPPSELSLTWGGANSRQGFGPRGGANGVPALIDQIELWFQNPVCVGVEANPKARSEPSA
jgi:hypothetical protein